MSTANTKTSDLTEDSNTKLGPDETSEYVKHPNGSIFHVLAHPRIAGKVYLHAKNSYQVFDFNTVRQGLVDGKWLTINEHEMKKHKASEELYQKQFTERLVKRMLFTQILMELDDELKGDFAGDKYFKAILERSEKQFERLIKETYGKLYETSSEEVNEFLRDMEGFITKAAKCGIEDFHNLNGLLSTYLIDKADNKNQG